jgi:hypothetical protein
VNLPGKDVVNEIGILHDLEIVHPDTDEICAALKTPAKSVLRENRTCGKRLEGNPRFLQRLHLSNNRVGVVAILVALPFRVAEGPVIALMERFEDLLLGMIGLDQVRDLDQVSRVGPTAHQVAAQNQPAQLYLADLGNRNLALEIVKGGVLDAWL